MANRGYPNYGAPPFYYAPNGQIYYPNYVPICYPQMYPPADGFQYWQGPVALPPPQQFYNPYYYGYPYPQEAYQHYPAYYHPPMDYYWQGQGEEAYQPQWHQQQEPELVMAQPTNPGHGQEEEEQPYENSRSEGIVQTNLTGDGGQSRSRTDENWRYWAPREQGRQRRQGLQREQSLWQQQQRQQQPRQIPPRLRQQQPLPQEQPQPHPRPQQQRQQQQSLPQEQPQPHLRPQQQRQQQQPQPQPRPQQQGQQQQPQPQPRPQQQGQQQQPQEQPQPRPQQQRQQQQRQPQPRPQQQGQQQQPQEQPQPRPQQQRQLPPRLQGQQQPQLQTRTHEEKNLEITIGTLQVKLLPRKAMSGDGHRQEQPEEQMPLSHTSMPDNQSWPSLPTTSVPRNQTSSATVNQALPMSTPAVDWSSLLSSKSNAAADPTPVVNQHQRPSQKRSYKQNRPPPTITRPPSPPPPLPPTQKNSPRTNVKLQGEDVVVQKSICRGAPSPIAVNNNFAALAIDGTEEKTPELDLPESPTVLSTDTTKGQTPELDLARSPTVLSTDTNKGQTPELDLAGSPTVLSTDTTKGQTPELDLAGSPAVLSTNTTKGQTPLASIDNQPPPLEVDVVKEPEVPWPPISRLMFTLDASNPDPNFWILSWDED